MIARHMNMIRSKPVTKNISRHSLITLTNGESIDSPSVDEYPITLSRLRPGFNLLSERENLAGNLIAPGNLRPFYFTPGVTVAWLQRQRVHEDGLGGTSLVLLAQMHFSPLALRTYHNREPIKLISPPNLHFLTGRRSLELAVLQLNRTL